MSKWDIFHSGQSLLLVDCFLIIHTLFQNVYMATEDVEEPEFQYVPDTPHISPLVPGTQALSQSMLLLEESLESGAITGQFEQLHRKNPSLAMDVCHTSDNQNKNRYRDISPYDNTRVILTQCPSGDYINANHVVMTIPGSGIINRYVQLCFHLLQIFRLFLQLPFLRTPLRQWEYHIPWGLIFVSF